MFGRSKEERFSTFLELPGGIPSHDTFGQVFSRLDPEQFQICFMGWTQEVAFGEDQCRIRKDYAPQKMATPRQISHNLLKKETNLKVGIQGKRLQAGWREDYLLKVLLG